MTLTPGARRALAVLAPVLLGAGVAVVFLVDFDDASSPPRRIAEVTVADNNGEVVVPVDQPFVVDLRGSETAPWGLPEATTESLARTRTAQALDGSASATFVPLEAIPEATITAERVPVCTTDTPCDQPAERFQVIIRVTG